MHLNLKAMKIALTSVCLLGATAAFAGGPVEHMGPTNETGAYVSANFGAFHATHEFDVTYAINDSFCQRVITHGLQNSFTAGAAFGYGFEADARYYFGFELGAQVMPHDAKTTVHLDSDSDTEIDALYDSEMNYNINFVVTPGVFISSNTLMYGVLGGSYAHLDTKLSLSETDDPTTKKNGPVCDIDQSIWGIVFGGGLRHYVSDNAAVFGEYDYFNYQEEKLGTLSTGINDDDSYTHEVDVHGGMYKFGVLVSFF